MRIKQRTSGPVVNLRLVNCEDGCSILKVVFSLISCTGFATTKDQSNGNDFGL